MIGAPEERPTWRRLPVLVLALLLAVTFLPLATGRSFLPFERYPFSAQTVATSSGQPYVEDAAHAVRVAAMPGAFEPDFGCITLLWSQDLFTAQWLRQGVLPLWDPYVGCGSPTLDSGQYRPFNPFRWPFFLWPTAVMYCGTLVLQLLFGGVGVYLWLRTRDLSVEAATIGAGVFVLNPWIVQRLLFLDAAAYLVLPWCMLLLRRARLGDRASLAGAALGFALMGHVSHPETALLMTLLAVVAVWEARRREPSPPTLGAGVGTLVAVGLMSAAALVVLWLPPVALLQHGFLYKQVASGFSLPYRWENLFTLASDLLVPPACAALAAAALRVGTAPKTWVACVAGSLLLLMPLPVLGHRLAELLWYRLHLPPTYLKPFLWVGVSLLAGHGAEALLHRRPGARGAAAVAGGSVAVAVVATMAALPIPPAAQTEAPVVAVLGLVLGVVAVTLLLPARTPTVRPLAVLLAICPLAMPIAATHLVWSAIDLRTGPVIEWFRETRPHDRVASVAGAFLPIAPNLCQVYQVRCMEQVSALFLNQYHQLFHHPRTIPTAVYFPEPDPELFHQGGATVVLAPVGAGRPGGPLLQRGAAYTASALPGSAGRVYFAETVANLDPTQGVLAQLNALERSDPRAAVVEAVGAAPPATWPQGPGPGTSIAFEEDGLHRVRLHTSAPAPGLLVVKDSWHPDWRATVDGAAVGTYRVNGCFRGVVVPEGDHRVEFRYRPTLLWVTLLCSLAVTLALLWTAVRGRSPARE